MSNMTFNKAELMRNVLLFIYFKDSVQMLTRHVFSNIFTLHLGLL